jgi:hypothetical protein
VGYAKVYQVGKIDEVDNRDQNIIINPAFSDLPSDHDSDIGNKGGSEKKKEMDIK